MKNSEISKVNVQSYKTLEHFTEKDSVFQGSIVNHENTVNAFFLRFKKGAIRLKYHKGMQGLLRFAKSNMIL